MKKQIKALLSRLISPEQYLKFIDRKARQFIAGENIVNIDFFFGLLSRSRKPVSFIHIGANDGIKNDPIHKYVEQYNWKGILVEPLPQMFVKLKHNYKNQSSLIFENAGIADESGDMDFYFLDDSYTEPDWLQQIGTFDRRAIEFNLENFPQFIDRISTCKIPALTLKELIRKNNISKIDLLLIDAEGFEYKILSQIDSIDLKPAYIFFEWGCMEPDVLEKLFSLLKKNNYRLYASGGDVLASHEKA